MATDSGESARMIDEATRAGLIGAVAYTYRGYPRVELLRQHVAANALGTLRRIGGCYLSQDVLAADKYVWMFTPGATGRFYALLDLGVHWLHLVEFVTGQRITGLTAPFSIHHRRRAGRGGMCDRERCGTGSSQHDHPDGRRQHRASTRRRCDAGGCRLDVDAAGRAC